MKKVFQEVCKFKKELIVIIVTVIGSTMCTLGLPSLISNIINTDIPNEDFGGILRTGGFMLILVVVGILCGIVTSHASAIVSMGVGKSLRSQIFKKVQYFSQTESTSFKTYTPVASTRRNKH